ncbi:MAG: hypothetical protein AB7E72_14725 [Lysobacterales bacterium]
MSVRVESTVAESTTELARRARAELLALPADAAPLTYQVLAQRLQLKPPHSIHRLVQALELCMHEDAAAGRPFIAARVISRARGGLPAPGFFALATVLGRHGGAETGPGAEAFHQAQLRALHGNLASG